MNVKTAKVISGTLLLAFHAIIVGLLIHYPIMGNDMARGQFWGWLGLEWIIYTLGVAFAEAGDEP